MHGHRVSGHSCGRVPRISRQYSTGRGELQGCCARCDGGAAQAAAAARATTRNGFTRRRGDSNHQGSCERGTAVQGRLDTGAIWWHRVTNESAPVAARGGAFQPANRADRHDAVRSAHDSGHGRQPQSVWYSSIALPCACHATTRHVTTSTRHDAHAAWHVATTSRSHAHAAWHDATSWHDASTRYDASHVPTRHAPSTGHAHPTTPRYAHPTAPTRHTACSATTSHAASHAARAHASSAARATTALCWLAGGSSCWRRWGRRCG